ncbi:phosphoenolpyruvate-protein phosphotransferase PtsI [Paenibacillus larvae subsp. larvae DSM 25719]|uniref:phosphoenolpyruvate--protein phosphotransferase n=1 Tax=Paenibacillus larvae TaxID=1464 RepID=UPI0003DBE052|nr:phosphoenolpyruvate--protein phosphotransferase [Paenibacillus larvae]ETK28328.1 phosphoenolpyruvate-protein phosphotransferase PtsI [Paenibacillus larvae subsp. larvae DSM 25719]
MELKGIAAASGYAIGPAFILQHVEVEAERCELASGEVKAEVTRLEEKVQEAIGQLEKIKADTEKKLGENHAGIFATHILVLQDEEYIGQVIAKIQEEKVNAEYALKQVTEELVTIFASMDNAYMNERVADFKDVCSRVLQLLAGVTSRSLDDFEEPVVLIADDLAPSDTAQLNRDKVAGFATNIGGRTSHSAIMARSMEIPAVVGLKKATEEIKDGDYVILDGSKGVIIINPEEDVLKAYQEQLVKYEKRLAEIRKYKDQPSISQDGHHVELVANIGNPQDALGARNNGAEGVGLYRTEFLYMGRNDFPSEEEQFEAYKNVAEIMGAEKPVVIRSLDIGGDKELPYLDLPKEMNPFLGYRAIRLCLDRKDLFKTQLRAILRASAHGNIKLMYPMISSLFELREANRILDEVKKELAAENIPFNSGMEVGMMIEVPAAAVIADQLAKEVNFFSIGTNDLVQYTMAVDRMNEKVSYLTQPFNPAILRLIHMVISAAHKEGKWAGMCGEMAGNLTAIPILLGLGLDEFSMSASSVLPARVLINKLNKKDMDKLAQQVLNMENAEEIQTFVQKQVPGVTELQM